MTRDELRSALQHPNVRAFLRVIREGESSQTDSAYRIMYGGGFFSSFSDHPRQKVTAHGITSSAAGAYQFLERTWDGLVAKYGFPDFSPECQDEAAVALIAGRGALQDLLRGDLSEVLDKCSYEWASLPPGRYGQPTLDAKRVYNTYEKWLAPSVPIPIPEPVAPEPEKTMPFPLSIIAAAAEALLPTVIDLFRGHGSKTSVRNADVIEKAGPALVEIAKTVSGQQGVAEAVQDILDSPSKSAAFRKAVEIDLDRLVGMIERATKIDDDSRDKAAARAAKDTQDFAMLLIGRQFTLLAALAAATVVAFMLALYFKASNEILVGLMVLFTGLVNATSSKWATMIEYRFGSSSGSAAKDEIIAASKR